MSTEEKDLRIAALEKELQDRDDQYAQEIAALNEQLVAAKSDPTEIPGSLEIKVEDVAKGKKTTVKIGFVNGLKSVAFAGNRTSTAALLKRANGEELTPDELRANPALGKAKPEAVKETLTKWYTKGANIFKVIPALLLLMLFTTLAEAQPTYNSNTVGGGRYFSNTPTTIDTLNAADTLIIYPSFKNTDLGDYVWELHTYAKAIADTITVTVYIEETMFEDPAQAYWVRTDTITLASAIVNGTIKQNITSGDIKGTRWRAFIVSSGSSSKAQILHRGRIRKKTVNTP